MMKFGFTRLITQWIGELTPRKNLKIMKAESSLITIVSKKCATLVHIKTPNGKSINMPIGGIVVIIRVVSKVIRCEISLTTSTRTEYTD